MWTAPATGQADTARAFLSKPHSGGIRQEKLGKKGRGEGGGAGQIHHTAVSGILRLASEFHSPLTILSSAFKKAELKNMRGGHERLAFGDNARSTRPVHR